MISSENHQLETVDSDLSFQIDNDRIAMERIDHEFRSESLTEQDI